MSNYFYIPVLLAAFGNASAMTMSPAPANLPAEIQSCVDNIQCFITASLFEVPNTGLEEDANGFRPDYSMRAHSLSDYRSGALVEKVIFEYSLIAPSLVTAGNYLSEPITGSAWFLVNKEYSLSSDSHGMEVFWPEWPVPTHEVSPNFPGEGDQTDVLFNNEALLSSHLYQRYQYGIDWDTGGSYEVFDGNATFSHDGYGWWPCGVIECSYGLVELNFLYFGFQDLDNDGLATLSFDSNADYGDGSLANSASKSPYAADVYSQYYVPTEVPLPAAAWLFLSGLGFILAGSRRNNAKK